MKVILLFIWLVMVFTHYSYAQATDTITIKTFAKENPVVQFHYREPANYEITCLLYTSETLAGKEEYIESKFLSKVGRDGLNP